MGSGIILLSSLYFPGFSPNYSWVSTTFKIRKEQSLLLRNLISHQSPPSLLSLKVLYKTNPFFFPNLFPTAPFGHVAAPSMQALSSPSFP